MFIHGLGADKRCFIKALDAPDLAGRALLIPDLAGFGGSRPPEGFSYTMEAQAGLLDELCRFLDVGRIAVVAHSMGGPVGIRLAEMWEDRITHFVNAAGNLIPDDCFYSRAVLTMEKGIYEAAGFSEFKELIRQRKQIPGRSPSSYSDSLERTCAEAMYESSRDLVRLSDGGDLLARFQALPCRKLYLHDEDNPVCPALLEALREADVLVEEMKDAGHGMMEENPAAFYTAVAGFLRSGDDGL